MKDTITDIKMRRSVKEFKQEQITDEELRTVLEAGMNAPSGGSRWKRPDYYKIIT